MPLTSPARAPRRALLPAVVVCVLLLAPAAARASATTSENWSGYAVHRTGTTFREVSARWREPSGTCAAGDRTYSAYWVGIGGYRSDATALEQIGSELDCTAAGVARASAWYELVPAASHRIAMVIDAGDTLSARVRIVGDTVHLTIADVTRHEHFTRAIVDSDLDLTSAEWIAEAPSDCAGSDCTVLALTDFGSVAFSGASAQTSTGAKGTIGSSLWHTTEITLRESTSTRTAGDALATTSVTATPSAASSGAFSVAYAGTTTTGTTTGSGTPPMTGPGGSGPPS